MDPGQFDLMFEIALDSWYTEPALWPKNRDWKEFNRWFNMELIDVAWDLVNQPLSSEPPQGPADRAGGNGASDNNR